MKKVLFSSLLVFALLSSNAVMAQDSSKTKDTKTKTECTKKDKKDCDKAGKKSDKDKKACSKTSTTEKKGCCSSEKK
ncbi:MAG: hypothetical protein ACK5MK_08575 [Dysgonomonas sp.]